MIEYAFDRVLGYLRAARSVVRSRFFRGGPFFLSHLITARCFARCPTCLWRGDSPEETDTGTIIDFYRRAARKGFISTTFWGGEPLLRDDMAEIAGACRSCGLATGLITNGYLLPIRARELAPHLDFLIVSVDFPNEEHDRFRGVPGMLKNALDGMEKVRAANSRTKIFINSVVSKANREYVDDLVRFAEEHGVTITFESVNDGDVRYPREEIRKGENLRLAPGEERETFGRICRLKREHRSINNSESYLRLFANGAVHYTCHAPKICLRIEPDGNVTNCLDRSHPLGNVYRDPLETILDGSRYLLLRKKAENCSRCVDSGAIESSLFWDFTPEVLSNSLKFFVR
jgi:MoaA/NifB/PqqE/SkfB family radical SAM enzyme